MLYIHIIVNNWRLNEKISINTFILNGGERYCLIIDKETGIPLYYPTLYITTQVRNKSDSISTIELIAGAISLLYGFLNDRNIYIEERLHSGENLAIHEIDALRDYCEKKTRVKKSLPYTLKEKRVVNNTTKYFRLTHIANYLGWLGRSLLCMSNHREHDIKELVEKIRARRPRIRRSERLIKKEKSLNDAQIASLLEAVRVGSESNPFKQDVQYRNRLIILMLYLLGIRSGELLNIRISDINFSDSSVAIRRRPDNMADPRVKQPLVKTFERKLPLSQQLAKELRDYITNIRRTFKNARKHEYLFVTHKSGPSQGAPLSSMAYHKAIAAIREVVPELNNLTGHKLRHTWNYEFSKKLDEMSSPLNESEQENLRSSLMGWSKGSGTARLYNARHIQNKAEKVALLLQESINNKENKNEGRIRLISAIFQKGGQLL
ncbi:site-specific integrase [Photorhabdus sp. APURE]|uniref:tyrosine-type recombinase/integrase n=1 Tax=Photorhabdus aballayi TaxID=2991723 RepID=UPI00223E8320|nr:site-specific integrase [Photorhabdus aballayi]MCW7547155.1 site-specific integrase [Photorhabdus aballayi]